MHLIVFVIAAAALVTPVAAGPTTVGEFLQELARVKSLAATDPQAASDALSGAGVSLPADLDLSAPLTEGLVARIATASGVKVSSTDADTTFDAERVDQFFTVFGSALAAEGSGITVRDPGTCILDTLGACAQPGADCEKNGKPGFCQPANGDCTCNTGKAKGKRKQVATGSEPE